MKNFNRHTLDTMLTLVFPKNEVEWENTANGYIQNQYATKLEYLKWMKDKINKEITQVECDMLNDLMLDDKMLEEVALNLQTKHNKRDDEIPF